MKQLIGLFLMIGIFACSDNCETKGNCSLVPNAGLCEAAIPRYYFDPSDGVCKEFLWGGCDGVVPFETLEACQGECSCN